MRLMERNDVFLLAGLTIALFVVFSRPIAQLLDYVRDIEATSGLQLTPGRGGDAASGGGPTPAAPGTEVCFPMLVGGAPVGVLGVSASPPLGDEQRRSLQAAAALLAVSIKNAELFREIHENSVRDSMT